MNLQQLRYLRETVRRDLNLTAAAQVLHTSQPGLSKAIRELEDELGITIFVRHGKRLTALTDAGREVLAIVERILLEIDNLKRSAANWHATTAPRECPPNTHRPFCVRSNAREITSSAAAAPKGNDGKCSTSTG